MFSWDSLLKTTWSDASVSAKIMGVSHKWTEQQIETFTKYLVLGADIIAGFENSKSDQDRVDSIVTATLDAVRDKQRETLTELHSSVCDLAELYLKEQQKRRSLKGYLREHEERIFSLDGSYSSLIDQLEALKKDVAELKQPVEENFISSANVTEILNNMIDEDEDESQYSEEEEEEEHTDELSDGIEDIEWKEEQDEPEVYDFDVVRKKLADKLESEKTSKFEQAKTQLEKNLHFRYNPDIEEDGLDFDKAKQTLEASLKFHPLENGPIKAFSQKSEYDFENDTETFSSYYDYIPPETPISFKFIENAKPIFDE